MLFFSDSFFKYLKYILANPFRLFHKVSALGVGMIQAPDVLPDGTINMCDDCPDMCVHDGKLVNSCRLDECRFWGGLLHIHMLKNQPKESPEKEPVEEIIIVYLNRLSDYLFVLARNLMQYFNVKEIPWKS